MRFRRLKRTLGVSTVVANMMMIVIVLSLAAILVAWTGTTYGTFSSGSQLYYNQRGQALQERFVIELVVFTSSNRTIMIFVRNVGSIDVQLVAVYISSTSGLIPTSWAAGSNRTTPPFSLVVRQVSEFSQQTASTWTSGTVFTIVVATARGNQATATARGP